MAKIGRHGKLLHYIFWFRVGHKLTKGHWMHGDTLFEQAKKEHAPVRGLAAIEPECEFVQISLQVIFFERALMCTHQPALNERGNAVYARQDLVGLLTGAFDGRPLVDVFVFGGTGIGYQPVGVDRRSRLDVLPNKRLERFGFGVGNNLQAAPPEALGGKQFHGNRHQHLAFCTAPSLAVPHTPEDRFVHFDLFRQHVVLGIADCAPEPVQHSPSGLIGTKPENPMQRFCGNPVFSGGQMPCCGKPHGKRRSGAVKDRARRGGDAIAARIAPPFAVLHAPSLGSVARWARKAVFPSNPVNVVKTGNITRKPRQKLGVVARVIDPGSG